jgi:peroxin-5
MPTAKEDIAKWEAEFNQLMSAQRDEMDLNYGGEMINAWDQGLGDYDEGRFAGSSVKYDDEGIPFLGDYTFGEGITGCSR